MKKSTTYIMGKIYTVIILFLLVSSCKTTKKVDGEALSQSEFALAFGSCNKHTLDNLLWDDVLATNPDVWVWGGDIVYADTDDVTKIMEMYDAQDKVKNYKKLKRKTAVIGTWDDHDYGLNDGGEEFSIKKQSQQAFLNFMDVPKESPRRSREGVYVVHDYKLAKGKVKIIVLDTRYFRTGLTSDTETEKRHKPNAYGEGTMLGEQQWSWLNNELENSKADFNILVSSVQFLSNEHGFECWGNFPHEVDRLKRLIVNSKAKGAMVLSGDRHISEFSKADIDGLSYPLIDFTSSGLTHAYSEFSGEPNPYREGEVVATESFGLVKIDMESRNVVLQILGNNRKVLMEISQQY